MNFTIEQILEKKAIQKDGTTKEEKKEVIAEKLNAVEYLETYTEEQKDAIIALKTKLANFCMKRALDDKLVNNSFDDVIAELAELSEAIRVANEQEVASTTLKLYLSK